MKPGDEVTEASGASAIAEAFASWDGALTHARRRFSNYDGCENRSSTIGPDYARFSASWAARWGAASRVDIAVWRCGVRP